MTRNSALSLLASASLPNTACLGTGMSNLKMSFTWSEMSGQYTGDLSSTSKNPRQLSLAANELAADTSYTFRVVGYMTETTSLNNSATVVVEVGRQALDARITGGAFRQVGRDSNFTLDASNSDDPDDDATAFAYEWSCVDSTGADCGLILDEAETVSVRDGSLAVGSYTFSLLLSKADRNATASTTIQIVAGSPPMISIAPLTEAKYNADAGFVSLSTAVSSKLSYSTYWTAVDSDVSQLFMASGKASSSVSGKLAVVVLVSSLTPGSTYSFQLTATDSDGSSSYATLSLVMNEAPSSGSLLVSPSSGFSLDTAFKFTALNWVDEDLPLTYVFGTLEVLRSGALDETTMSPFGSESADSTYSGVTLSPGSNFTNYTVSTLVHMCRQTSSLPV